MAIIFIPFVVITRDDVDGLDAERVGGAEGGGDVAEVAEAFDDEAERVAPVPDDAPEPPPPFLGDAGSEGVDDLSTGQNGAVAAAKGVEVGEPARRVGVEERLAVHLHERGDSVGG